MSCVSVGFSTAVHQAKPADASLRGDDAYVADLLHAKRYAVRKAFLTEGRAFGQRVAACDAYSVLLKTLHLGGPQRPRRRALARLLQEQSDEAGTVDPEKLGATRGAWKISDTAAQREQERYCGVLTRVQAAAIKTSVSTVGLGTPRPENILGATHTSPPYAVLGDTERMLALECAVLEGKENRLRSALSHLAKPPGSDTIPTGAFLRQLKPALVSLGHKHDIPLRHVLEMVRTLDPHRTGAVSLNKFIRHYASDLLQRPSLRGSLGMADVLAWEGGRAPRPPRPPACSPARPQTARVPSGTRGRVLV